MNETLSEPAPAAALTLTFEQQCEHQRILSNRYAIDSTFWSPVVPLLNWVIKFAWLWLLVWPEVKPIVWTLLKILAGKDGAL